MTRRVALISLALSLLPTTFARAGAADPIVCAELIAAAPTVDSLPTSRQNYIDPATGDTWIGGQPVYDCPPYDDDPQVWTPAPGHISIHRFPGGQPFLAAAPSSAGLAWSCYDANTGAAVGEKDTLAAPNPGVFCYPPSIFSGMCYEVRATGVFSSPAGGGMTVTSACSGLSATSPGITSSHSAGSESFGAGGMPWLCGVSEMLVDPLTTDYWAYCDVNVNTA